MAMTPLQYASQALLRLGAQTIASFEDATVEAHAARLIYGPARDALLASHPWSFATETMRLAPLNPRFTALDEADSPDDGARAFVLPAGVLRVMSAGRDANAEGLDYRLANGALLACADSLWLRAVMRVDEARFPAWFDAALILRLASELCLPLTESPTRAEMLAKAASDAVRQARLIDSQQQPTRGIQGFALSQGRRP